MKNETEVWKPVEGYEEFYDVSNTGIVRSVALYSSRYRKVITRKCPIILKPETTHDGYKRVLLCRYGEKRKHSVHRLVAKAFIPNPGNSSEVNHKDECTSNNHVSNLEWCTGKYNSNYGTLPDRIRKRQTNNPKRSKPVIQLTLEGKEIRTFPSTREAARYFGIRSENISRCCSGKNKLAAGYKWKYG